MPQHSKSFSGTVGAFPRRRHFQALSPCVLIAGDSGRWRRTQTVSHPLAQNGCAELQVHRSPLQSAGLRTPGRPLCRALGVGKGRGLPGAWSPDSSEGLGLGRPVCLCPGRGGGGGGTPCHIQHSPNTPNHWAPRTRKRHQQEHRPQRPTESSDPTQHAKGRTGDCPGPHKETTTRRNVTRGGGTVVRRSGLSETRGQRSETRRFLRRAAEFDLPPGPVPPLVQCTAPTWTAARGTSSRRARATTAGSAT